MQEILCHLTFSVRQHSFYQTFLPHGPSILPHLLSQLAPTTTGFACMSVDSGCRECPVQNTLFFAPSAEYGLAPWWELLELGICKHPSPFSWLQCEIGHRLT